jgi:hypothetical protein
MRFRISHKQNEAQAEVKNEVCGAEINIRTNVEQLIVCRAIYKNCSTLWTALFAFVSV